VKPANNAPIYACVYAGLAEIARAHGYALAIHGSLARDFDVIAIPWTEAAADPWDVVQAILAKYSLRLVEESEGVAHAMKPHGRMVYTLVFKFGDVFLDLGFMPRLSPVQ
jgi:hypothetical protein